MGIAEPRLQKSDGELVNQLRDLKRLGVRLAVDRISQGTASLGTLSRPPPGRPKIDASVVEQLLSDPANAAIARATIALAHSLDVAITATGVRTSEQLAFLGAGARGAGRR